ncbi:hypothetical protein ABT282_08345 [Streptomyces sp. NPDC000927]|uniref:hypothetical protein n=1 Tax=Streptomyces sp. NPDC000927 TaxID=3154371 RepID=UPI00331ADBFB
MDRKHENGPVDERRADAIDDSTAKAEQENTRLRAELRTANKALAAKQAAIERVCAAARKARGTNNAFDVDDLITLALKEGGADE